jgi:mannitol-1-phosphate 5-dehydrogenase
VSLTGNRTFVGFGFGAIQAGLFLYEAFHSGNFRRLIVAEVLPDAVKALRQAAGMYSVNVAHRDRVEAEAIGPVEIANPENERDREFLIAAVAEAEEMATALPSVKQYVSESAGSVHRILAEALRRKAECGGPPAVLYAAENHNHAAEILEGAIMRMVRAGERQAIHRHFSFLNTVIGKMSGAVVDAREIRERSLETVTPQEQRAFLVESFNRILVSKISGEDGVSAPGLRRGIEVFEEKADLLPFEEAKLYGHNSTHAVAAYLGALLEVKRIADLNRFAGVAAFLEAAFVQESGGALIRRHRGVDPLFTDEGYQAFATDLLLRMFNPYLGDTIERVGRDPARKLEWDDRLAGTIRICLQQGVNPQRYSIGAAAAVAELDPSAFYSDLPLEPVLDRVWHNASPDSTERRAVLRAIEHGRVTLRLWHKSGFPDLERFVQQRRSEW